MITKYRVCIREHGFLIEGQSSDKGTVSLSKTAFAYLRGLIQDEQPSSDFSPFLKLTTYKRQTTLKVQNYVGVLQTPCGTLIEVLPKLQSYEDETEEKTRHQLIKML